MTEEEKALQLEKEQEEAKTYSEEEVTAKVQSETDKRVSQALKTAEDKWKAEYKEKLEVEKSEAEKLAKLSETERYQVELDKQKEEFESERKSFFKEKLELQTVKELSAEGLPTDFSSYLLAETAEDTSANIKTFKSQWEQAIANAVDERLKGRTPSVSSSTGLAVTKEQFNKMDYKERVALMEKDSDLYESLRQ